MAVCSSNMMAVCDGGLRWRFAMAVCFSSIIAVCDGAFHIRRKLIIY